MVVASDVTLEVRPEEAEAFVGRLLEATVGGWELLAAHLGLQLGLYAALSESRDGMTTTAVAEATGVHPRYVQEWLEQQAEKFGEAIGNPVERLMYAASVLCCLPAAMAEQPSRRRRSGRIEVPGWRCLRPPPW